MKNNLIIITNESIYLDENNKFFCDNIDLKSIPEGLSNYANINLIARYSKKIRSKKINIKKISTFKNIFTYLISIFKSFEDKNSKYLIISLSPYTFFASLLLKFFSKQHFIYLRSDGYQEYRSILGVLGPFIYNFFYKIGTLKAKLIACIKNLLKNNDCKIVHPSQLSDKWFEDLKDINPNKIKLLYVGRVRIEKGIFSLINILRDTNLSLTIITSEKNIELKEKFKNINLMSFDNYNDAIIEMYDKHSIFILPSYTEAHPQVLDEALARCRPVIVFKEIDHVVRDREGVFVCERDRKSLESQINYINNNYENILSKIKTNKLPTKKSFIDELKKIIFN